MSNQIRGIILEIELKDINLTFKDKQILSNLNLIVKDGDKVLISGNSGKGKSTLFKILLGFQRFESGSYLINGKDYKKYDISEVRNNFAYVDQDVSIRNIIVKDYFHEIHKFQHNNINEEIDKSLCDYFDFDLSLLEKEVSLLSGGERQRMAIIIAIMLERPCFLLDEVTAALDKDLKMKVVNYFVNSNKTVLAVSHDSIWLKNDKFKKVIL